VKSFSCVAPRRGRLRCARFRGLKRRGYLHHVAPRRRGRPPAFVGHSQDFHHHSKTPTRQFPKDSSPPFLIGNQRLTGGFAPCGPQFSIFLFFLNTPSLHHSVSCVDPFLCDSGVHILTSPLRSEAPARQANLCGWPLPCLKPFPILQHSTTPTLQGCHGVFTGDTGPCQMSRVVTGRVTGRCSEKARLYWFVTVSRVGAGGSAERLEDRL
jgi:hypothetical protein